MSEIQFNNLTQIEEIQSILSLYYDARKYLEDFDWCVSIKKVWYDKDLGIYKKLGIFLFEITPVNDTVDDFIWVIVGESPSIYLDKSVTTSREALELYCKFMQDWAEHVKSGRSLDECYPIEEKPTIKNANMLITRISFIRQALL